ncbi:MAG TPA: hypothetical protein VL633_05340 [Bacteroidota bacterium]|nr:hypothetical protein [Bacteroidota bacterium]
MSTLYQALRNPYVLLIVLFIGMPGSNELKAQHKNVTPFACDMSVMTPEEREHHAEVGRKMFGMVKEVKELRDGFALRFDVDSAMISTVAQFVEKERLCCPFMKFTVEVGQEHGPLWVSITGRKGAKEFIRSEFDLDSLNR